MKIASIDWALIILLAHFLTKYTFRIFLPDIEHIYMSEKNSNHVKERLHLKNAPTLAGEIAQKLAAKFSKIQNNSAKPQCQRTCRELQKTQPSHPVGYSRKNSYILGYIKISMVQINYRPVPKVPVMSCSGNSCSLKR